MLSSVELISFHCAIVIIIIIADGHRQNLTAFFSKIESSIIMDDQPVELVVLAGRPDVLLQISITVVAELMIGLVMILPVC